ncbi:hypothetical protein OIU78_020326 [Salix suchowensis]|nr:hypothetical protein OIU78_020326 [Salix suchowensis]
MELQCIAYNYLDSCSWMFLEDKAPCYRFINPYLMFQFFLPSIPLITLLYETMHSLR